MGKEKLKKFSSFVLGLLPHETMYLKKRLHSTDADRLKIMDEVFELSKNIDSQPDFDTTIDKRKYSKMLRWIQNELAKIDVDLRLSWVLQTHQSIILDQVSLELDTLIQRSIKRYVAHDFYFLQYYDMLLAYRHYLLIRMQYQTHQLVDNFLEKYRFDYQKSKIVYEQLHQATADIIGSGNLIQNEAIQWKRWLFDCVKDANLDGQNRYMAAIRLIFVCLRYKMYEDLRQVLALLDDFLNDPKNYSKRILVNFYDNKLVYYDKIGQFDEARFYGYLSVKFDHPDAIIYINNLVNVLLKARRFNEALKVIERKHFKIKDTKNFHSAIGFVSNHIRSLTKVERIREAVNKGYVFLQAYDKKIMKYRWHRFFAAYNGALLVDEQYEKILKLNDKYDLSARERNSVSSSKAQLVLNIYETIAKFQLGQIEENEFKARANEFLDANAYQMYDEELLAYFDGLA